MANAQDVQNAIAANDNTKRLTDVPKFYGNSKDTLTAREFMKRLEQAANIRNWNNKRKCAFIALRSQRVHVSNPRKA